MDDLQKLAEAITKALKADSAKKDARKSHEFAVLKVDAGDGIVYGWGMVSSIKGEPYYDTDNEHIPSDVLRKSAAGFMQQISRLSNLEHQENDVGQVVFGFPLTNEIAKAMGISSEIEGFMIGMKPDKATLAKFASGELTGFSLEGTGIAEDEE